MLKKILVGLLCINFYLFCHSEEIKLPKDAKADYSLEIYGKKCDIYKGRLYVNGVYTFLKQGKPLRNFADKAACQSLIDDLPKLKELNFNNLVLNCYWHKYDKDGDGIIDVDLTPLRNLLDEMKKAGIFASIAVETYAVGGGTIPEGFFKKYPEAAVIDQFGKKGVDSEYGFGTKIPSLFNKDYLRCTRLFIENLGKALSDKEIFIFETTVEPQYTGDRNFDYSENAKVAFEEWGKKNHIALPDFPKEFPVEKSFIDNRVWNVFKGEYLGKWVSDDAKAFRKGYKKSVFVAVDYLDASENTMQNRMGIPELFLMNLKDVQVIQVNWHWYLGKPRSSNAKAYARVRSVMTATNQNWAVSEHMTINGSDFDAKEMKALLRNTIKCSTNFAWDFVDIVDNSKYNFTVYQNEWRPKPAMAVVDDNWDMWVDEINAEVLEKISEER